MNARSRSVSDEWAAIAETLGAGVVGDMRMAYAQCPPSYVKGHYDRGLRVFSQWLLARPDDPDRKIVIDAYSNDRAQRLSSEGRRLAALFATNAAIQQFHSEVAAFASASGSMAWILHRCVVLALERLGRTDGGYPAIIAAVHSHHRPIGNTPMLGSLTEGELPIAAGSLLRERQALDSFGDLSLDEFRDHVALVDAGASIRFGDLPCNSVAARDLIHRALASAWSILARDATGWTRDVTYLLWDGSGSLDDAVTWLDAGLPEKAVRRFGADGERMTRAAVGKLILACLGPTRTMLISGAGTIACARGWNKSSILAIPPEPFVFSVNGKHGLASGSFVSAWKARAGHPVTMFLADPEGADDTMVGSLLAEWRATAAGAEADQLGEQMLLGGEDEDPAGAAVLEVLRELVRVSTPVRLHCSGYPTDRLFACPTLNRRHDQDFDKTLVFNASTTPAIAASKATFRSIRASWVYLDHQRRRSVTATSAACGQTTSTVLLTHYLNRPEVGLELRKPLRFFQEVCQALVVDGVAVAVTIGLDGLDMDRIRRLAWASGMAAAFGLGPAPSAPPPALEFIPNLDNLRDLFLTLWAIRIAARKLPPASWRVRCLELFAIARAVASELRANGLARDYAAAARAAYGDLKAGKVALPCIEGG